MQTQLQMALNLKNQGFFIFPCVGKKPALKGWQTVATRDDDQIRSWWTQRPECTVGIATEKFGDDSEALIVVDVDRRPNKDGHEQVLKLELQGFELPDTRTQNTPGGGYHLIYRSSQPVRQSAGAIAPGIDIRSRGGYVIAYSDDGKPPAAVPPWLPERCGSPRERSEAPVAPPVTVDPDRALKRAIEYLERDAPIATAGGRNDAGFRTAARLKDFGLDRDACFATMAEHWKCEPPLDPDELQHVVNSAYRYGQERQGIADPAADFEPVAPLDGPVPFGTLLQRDPQPVAELIPGLIEKGIPTFLDGPGGSCKSRLALQLGLCLDAGNPVFGRSVERCRLVYLSSEDGLDEVTRRTHAIVARLELPRDMGGQFWDRKDQISALAEVKEGGEIGLLPFHRRLVEYLKSIPGHKFVVLDSIYDFVRYAGHAKIDEGSVNAFIKQTLGALCSDTDSTLLVIRHPSQAGAERGDMSGWSVANHNAPRARLSMAADKNTRDAYVLKVEKRNHGACGEPITLYWTEGALLPRTELQGDENQHLLYRAVVDLAKAQVEAGDPLKRQSHLQGWQLDQLQQVVGYRPTQQAVKEELSRAVGSLRSLIYIQGDSKRAAGYFPAENADAISRQLRRGENRGENRLKTGVKSGGKTG